MGKIIAVAILIGQSPVDTMTIRSVPLPDRKACLELLEQIKAHAIQLGALYKSGECKPS